MVIFVTVVLVVCVLALLRTYWLWQKIATRRRELYPQDTPTLYDVRNLLLRGETEIATRVYCQIFGISYGEAKKAVRQLERSIKGNKTE